LLKIIKRAGFFLLLDYNIPEHSHTDISVNEIKNILVDHVDRLEMRRFDIDRQHFNATFFISIKDADNIDDLMSQLKEKYQGINISILEQHNIAGV
jgi:hypothetical protein